MSAGIIYPCDAAKAPRLFQYARIMLVSAILGMLPCGAAFADSEPDPGFNPQLDPGIQGAAPGYQERNSDGTPKTKHVFMPPKNTPAKSLVDNYPWLFMHVPPNAQGDLYRGGGGIAGYDVNNPLRLTSTDTAQPRYSTFLMPATDTGEPTSGGLGEIDTLFLNKTKCIDIKVDTGKCLINPASLLSALPGGVYNARSPSVFNRLRMDSCTNQAILPMALNPRYVFNDQLRWHDASYNESWCQPFKMKKVDCIRNRLIPITKCLPDTGSSDGWLYDYRAWGYLRLAWKSVLTNKGYTPSGGTGFYFNGADGIGGPPYLTWTTLIRSFGVSLAGLNMPEVISLVTSNDDYTKLGNSPLPGSEILMDIWPGGILPYYEGSIDSAAVVLSSVLPGLYGGKLTTINQLAEMPYERIWDPTHPYSPRWDFRRTDRSYSNDARVSESPKIGQGFSTSTSTCIVRCAAVPVDIMTFRANAFSKCIGARIQINSRVWWREANYLNTTIPFFLFPFTFPYLWTGYCNATGLVRAVNDTTRDRIWGAVFLFYQVLSFVYDGGVTMATVNLQIALKIPYARHGRIPVGFTSSKWAGDHIYIKLAWWLGGFKIHFPGMITSGCHFMTDPAILQFIKLDPTAICGLNGYSPLINVTNLPKTILHNMWNPDRCISNIQPPALRQPQPKSFDSQWPICSTKYDVQDSSVHYMACAPADVMSGDVNVIHGIRNCCDNVAHALAPLNTLKIRNTIFNPGLKPTPEGYAFDGYFSARDNTRVSPDAPSVLQAPDPDNASATIDYVSSHMPYMRWWDTGFTAGGPADWVGIKDYDPDSDCGKYDTIMGIGTEDWAGDGLDTANPPVYAATTDKSKWHPAKYCRYGGNGFMIDTENGLPFSADVINKLLGTVGINNINDLVKLDLSQIGLPPFYECIRLRTIDVGNRKLGPDAMTSWEELKLYQMRSMRMGLNCMPEYEKLHKPQSPEDFVLDAAGGGMQVPVYVNRSAGDNTDANDATKGPEQGYYKVPYRGAPSMNPSSLGSNPNAPTQYDYTGSWGNSITMQQIRWPLAWRGYVSDVGDAVDGLDAKTPSVGKSCNYSFPNFSGDRGNFLLRATGIAGTLGINNFTVPCPAAILGSTDGQNQSFSGFGGVSQIWHVPGVSSPLGNIVGSSIFSSLGIGTNDPWPPGEFWPVMPGGLDRAIVGDIVFINQEDIDFSQAMAYLSWDIATFASSMPHPAIVEGVHNHWIANDGTERDPVDTVGDCPATERNCFTKCESWVRIRESNMGKFPDACANTDMYGFSQPRTIYKEWLPPETLDLIFPAGVSVINSCGNEHTAVTNPHSILYVPDTDGNDEIEGGLTSTNWGNCADAKMKVCTFADFGYGATSDDLINLWNHYRIYRPTYDIRQ